MAQGRDSAVIALALLSMLVLQSEMAHATTHTVGGPSGWTFNMESWPKGKHFKAGDTLVFNYSPAAHNLVLVNKAGYDGCTVPKGSRTLTTGKDQVKLVKGTNYFLCSFPGHCEGGMKIAVTAT